MKSLVNFIFILFLSFNYSTISHANVVGSDAQNFNPVTSGLDFVTVHSSETLNPGLINVGMFINYAVNTLPYFDNTPQGRTTFNDSLTGVDLNLGVGIGNSWDAGISIPFLVQQTASSDNSYRGQFATTGNTEIRLNTKYRVVGYDSGGVAFIASANFNRIIDNPYAGIGAGPTYNLEVAADTTINQVALGVNLGYRWRNPGRQIANSPIQPLHDQIIASLGASYLFPNIDTKVISEIFASVPAERRNADLDRSLTTSEFILGAKHDFTTQLSGHIGGGTEIGHGVSSPDWRVYTGINYTFGPAWERKGEPVPNIEVIDPNRFRTRNIYFSFDSDLMVGQFSDVLDDLVQALNQSGAYKELVVEGHSDSIGPAIYNEDLSLRRAQAIRKYLLREQKMAANKVSAVGYGESRPIANNGNYQGRRMNRRVEFKVIR